MHQAILLSKLAYEEQLVSAAKPEKEQEHKKSGKKSKKATMSLEEFNSMGVSAAPIVVIPNEPIESKSKGMIYLKNWEMYRKIIFKVWK